MELRVYVMEGGEKGGQESGGDAECEGGVEVESEGESGVGVGVEG